jgi:hypothetical protein
MAQEIFALSEPGDLAVVRIALRRLISELGRAAIFYEREGERPGAITALEAVLRFLDLFRSIRYGDIPLRALLRGLESLELGAVEPMLQAKKTRGGRPVYLQSALFRGTAAGAVELARRSGQTLSQAHDFVADQLNAAGYRLPARTVREQSPARLSVRGALRRSGARSAIRCEIFSIAFARAIVTLALVGQSKVSFQISNRRRL